MSAPIASSIFLKTEHPHARLDKNEQGSHCRLLPYDNNGWKHDLGEAKTFIQKKKTLNPRDPFVYLPFFKILNSLFECTHWRGDTSHLCTLCMLMPQKVPLLELILFYTWYEQSIPGATNSLGYVGVEVAWKVMWANLLLLVGMESMWTQDLGSSP